MIGTVSDLKRLVHKANGITDNITTGIGTKIFRANAVGESMDQMTAKKKARSNAQSELAKKLQSIQTEWNKDHSENKLDYL